ELAEDSRQVGLDGLLADPERRSDLLVHLALGDEARHLELGRRLLVAAGGLLAQDLAAAGERRGRLLLPGRRAEPPELLAGGVQHAPRLDPRARAAQRVAPGEGRPPLREPVAGLGV